MQSAHSWFWGIFEAGNLAIIEDESTTLHFGLHALVSRLLMWSTSRYHRGEVSKGLEAEGFFNLLSAAAELGNLFFLGVQRPEPGVSQSAHTRRGTASSRCILAPALSYS